MRYSKRIQKLSACAVLGATLISFGSVDNAEAKVSKSDLSKAQAAYSQGIEQFGQGNTRAAAANFMQADKLAEDNALYEVLSGDTLKELQQYPSAIRYYQDAIDHSGKSQKGMKDKIRQKAYIGLAEASAGNNDMETALKYADKSIHEYDKDYRGHYIKGIVLQKSDPKAAAEEFKKSLEVDKTQYNSYAKLIDIYKAANDVNSVIKTYQQGVDYRPLDEDMKMSLAQLYISESQKAGATKNYYPQALEVLKSLTAINNKNAQVHYYLSTIYLLTGDRNNCYQELANTNALNPNLGNRLSREIEAYVKKQMSQQQPQTGATENPAINNATVKDVVELAK